METEKLKELIKGGDKIAIGNALLKPIVEV